MGAVIAVEVIAAFYFLNIIIYIYFLFSLRRFSSYFFFFASSIAALFLGQLLEMAKWGSLQYIYFIDR